MGEVEHVYETYNDIHNIIAKSAAKIADEFKPDMLIAIGAPIRRVLVADAADDGDAQAEGKSPLARCCLANC